jgi:RNA polymerase sigma-70 factor (ECF subfamily)
MYARQLAQLCGQHLAPAALEELTRLLDAGLLAAHARWPEVSGHEVAFVEALAIRLEGEQNLVDALSRLVVPDVYLVAAVLAGDSRALSAVERLTREETTRAVTRLGATGPPAEDVVQELLVKLVVPRDNRPPKLAAFGGHGSLQAWLKVAAVRTAISLGRRKQEELVEEEVLATIADDGDDQGLAFLKASYRGEFKTAFAATFAELPPRARTLLRLQIVNQLSLEEIGLFYRVSRATAARWLADARASLVSGTQERLVATLEISTEELAELMRLVASSLYSTLTRLIQHTESPVQPA